MRRLKNSFFRGAAGFGDLGDDGVFEPCRSVLFRHSGAGRGFLLRRPEEDRRAVLFAHVQTLAAQRRRVVNIPEQLEKLFIGYRLGVEFDFDRLGMSRPARTDFAISRRRGGAADETDAGMANAGKLAERRLHTPITARRECRFGHDQPRFVCLPYQIARRRPNAKGTASETATPRHRVFLSAAHQKR